MTRRVGNTEIEGRVVSVGTMSTRLSRREEMMLRRLISANGRMVTRSAMVDAMWEGRADGIEEKTVDTILSRLRHKLGLIGSDIVIQTTYGEGWVIPRDTQSRTFVLTTLQYTAVMQCIDGHGNDRVAQIARAALS